MTNAVSIAQYGTNNPSWRNRIINGDMRIDQRNAGAAVSVNADASFFAVDRFPGFGQNTDGVFAIQRTTVVPAGEGFTNSLRVTVTTADASVGATQTYLLGHMIEGFNVADLEWGTANAKSVTLSFWTRSSVTGTHGGAILNSAQSYSYPFTYTISAADTWEKKTITIPGPTAGTWLTDNGIGLRVFFGVGVGSTYKAAAGSWVGVREFSATGAVDLISTLNATWYVTGVQLEAGSVATPFERRPYGTELALCQRYYWKNNTSTLTSAWGSLYNTTSGRVWRSFPVPMRAAPSLTVDTNTFHLVGFGDVTGSLSGVAVDATAVSFDGTSISTAGSVGQPFAYARSFQVSAEL